jgi:hypothetical protein
MTTRWDAIIIVPPFAGIDRASLGVHVLQAIARLRGFSVHVFYGNLRLAAHIGATTYLSLCYGATSSLLGERLFARTAYGSPALGREDPEDVGSFRRAVDPTIVNREDLLRIEALIPTWVDDLVEEILSFNSPIVGSSTTFEQTAASVAILDRVKACRKNVITIIGGANCEGEMAEGIRSLTASIDYIFSGECELVFPDFLASVAAKNAQRDWLVSGTPCADLDAIPCPDFDDYYTQLDRLLPASLAPSNRRRIMAALRDEPRVLVGPKEALHILRAQWRKHVLPQENASTRGG